MGFSTSGSAVVVFIGLFLMGNMFFSGTMNGLEAVNDARGDEAEDLLTLQTANVTFDDASRVVNTLHIYVNNTGASSLSVSDTDVLVDGKYTEPTVAQVRGDRETDVWAPGETLHIIDRDAEYEGMTSMRLKIVAEQGVAITVEVDL